MATCHAVTREHFSPYVYRDFIGRFWPKFVRDAYECRMGVRCVPALKRQIALDIITFRPYSTEWASEPTERWVCQCTASTRCQRSARFNCNCTSGWSKPYSLSLSAKAVSNKSLCCFASPKIPCKAPGLAYGDTALVVRKKIEIPIIHHSSDLLSYFQTVAIQYSPKTNMDPLTMASPKVAF